MKCLLVFLLFLALDSSAGDWPTKTNGLITTLDKCQSQVDSDIACLTSVENGLGKMMDGANKVHKLRQSLFLLKTGLATFNSVVSIAKYAPAIGTSMTAVKATLNVYKQPINKAYERVKKADEKLKPWKKRVSTAKSNVGKAKKELNKVKTACTNGETALIKSRTCLNAMTISSLKSPLTMSSENFCGTMNPGFKLLERNTGLVGTACSSIKDYTDIALTWPDISGIMSEIEKIYNVLKPILNLFAELRKVLNKKLCMVNPLEVTREAILKAKEVVAEKAKAAARAAAEKAEEAKEVAKNAAKSVARSVRRWFGRRRRRSLSTSDQESLQLSADEANSFLVSKRASDICFSIQQILDGIDKAFGFLLDQANKLIAKALQSLPSFSIPGLPTFNLFDVNFDLPDPLLFPFDFNLYAKFPVLNWNCPAQLFSSCSTKVATVTNCASVSISWNKKSIGDEVLELTSLFERDEDDVDDDEDDDEDKDEDDLEKIVELLQDLSEKLEEPLSLDEAREIVKEMNMEDIAKLVEMLQMLEDPYMDELMSHLQENLTTDSYNTTSWYNSTS